MVLDLVIIGLAITLEPLTLVAFILIVGAQQGIRKGLAFILGWLACLVAVIAVVVLVTGGKPPEPHTAPSTAALVVKALLGAVLIWVGLRQRQRQVKKNTVIPGEPRVVYRIWLLTTSRPGPSCRLPSEP